MSRSATDLVVIFGDMGVVDVAEFHMKFDFLVSEKPTMLHPVLVGERIVCMREELDEFDEAARKGDICGMADALIDLTYFVKGTAAMMGLPWGELWRDVHRANMSKVRGTTHRGHKADVKKPPGWEGPKTAQILLASGFDIRQYLDPLTGTLDDSLLANHPAKEEDE